MPGWNPFDGRSETARKIAVSLVLGAVTFALTQVFRTNDTLSIGASVFASGVVLVIQFLLSVERQLERVRSDVDGQLNLVAARMASAVGASTEAARLFGAVDSSAVARGNVEELVRNIARMPINTVHPLTALADEELGRLSRFFRELSEGGELFYDGENRDWLLALARKARTSICATSSMVSGESGRSWADDGLWNSDLGQRYLECQRDAARRGVVVRRVFILQAEDQLADPGFQDLLAHQRDLGFDVRVLPPRKRHLVPKSALFGFAIFDDVASYETTFLVRTGAETRSTVITTRLVVNRDRVRNRVRGFHDLWANADETGARVS
ncbi:MAG: hypothetical protein AUI14_08650 [Actinobacteria bacterium 13_2_20CM_2_71_6]|nr:MAG: hypothetical protein AUI14_08650 [Actinobacteria bacterium 13_2_20CM_2_71_6]